MKAVVMAGGEGSRLRPVTTDRPKPLVPVVNRPIMEHIIGLLRAHGVTEIVATLHYMADEIQAHFGDGSEFGVQMRYSIEQAPLGTAGSVKEAEPMLMDSTFIIVSGDALTDCDLTEAVRAHRAAGAVATLVLARVPNPLEFGIVITDAAGRVERFLEKPTGSEVFTDTVNTGIYILEPKVFEYMTRGRPYDWSKDIFPQLLLEGALVYGHVMAGHWSDVGTISQYMDAQVQVLSGQIALGIPGEEVRPGVWVGRNTLIDDTAQIVPPVCIGRNSRVKRHAKVGPYTVIGDSTLVDEDATIERSVVWDSSYLGTGVQVTSAAIGSRVTIKRDSVVQEDAVIGDRCLLDVGCTIRPRVKLWPDKLIERASTVTMSLVSGSRWRGALFRDLGVAGLSNIEVTPEFATRLGLAFGSLLPDHSRVIVSRDSARSSRMVKRSLMASLLSTGCDVVDLHGCPVPITRHHVHTIGAQAAMNVRKLPGNARLSLIEIFDQHGGYLDRATERKVETAFFREEFRRIDPDDLGQIEESNRAVDLYRRDFLSLVPDDRDGVRAKLVVDYGYSSISPVFPAMLQALWIDALTLNGHTDAKLAPRTTAQIRQHLDHLAHIVASVGYDVGVLITDEGERLAVIDDRGRPVVGNRLFAALCLLAARTHPRSRIVMSVTAPNRLEELLVREGVSVVRTRSCVRDLMAAVHGGDVTFAGDENGGFIFPALHPGFDAMYGTASLVAMLDQTGCRLSEVVDELPHFHLAYEQVECAWDAKGAVMRRLGEEHREGQRLEMVDGIKIYDEDAWVLVKPDSFEPVFHVYAESADEQQSAALVADYADRIRALRTV